MSPKLNFTEADSERANKEWGANCGPHALAAALYLDLATARTLLPGFDTRQFTNPSMMSNALNLAGISHTLTKGLKTKVLCEGINRIQWEGRWLNPGVPAAAAYRYTHWVAAMVMPTANGPEHCVFCTCMPGCSWWPRHEWSTMLDGLCREEKFAGWHVTHHYAFEALCK